MPADKRGSRAKAWCFTSYEDAEPVFKQETAYYCYGRETCPTTGRRHWQGYCVFTNRKRLGEIKKKENNKWHYEAARGTVAENVAYTKKDGEWKEIGVRPSEKTARATEANARKWLNIRRDAEQGRFNAIESKVYIHHCRALHYIYEKHQQDRKLNSLAMGTTVGLWIAGPPGVGKSTFIRQQLMGQPDGEIPDVHGLRGASGGILQGEVCSGNSLYTKDCTKWWSGYAHEPYILIEDIDISQKWMSHFLKIWADIHPFQAEIKGGAIKIRPRLVCITSNYMISDIWKPDADEALYQAINRRFHSEYIQTREEFNEEARWSLIQTTKSYKESAIIKQEVVDVEYLDNSCSTSDQQPTSSGGHCQQDSESTTPTGTSWDLTEEAELGEPSTEVINDSEEDE